MLKETGVYVLNIMARNPKFYLESLNKLENIFETIFMVHSNEDLNRIHFCFKNKLESSYFSQNYEANLNSFTKNANVNFIDAYYKNVISRVTDIKDFKIELENNIKI